MVGFPELVFAIKLDRYLMLQEASERYMPPAICVVISKGQRWMVNWKIVVVWLRGRDVHICIFFIERSSKVGFGFFSTISKYVQWFKRNPPNQVRFDMFYVESPAC